MKKIIMSLLSIFVVFINCTDRKNIVPTEFGVLHKPVPVKAVAGGGLKFFVAAVKAAGDTEDDSDGSISPDVDFDLIEKMYADLDAAELLVTRSEKATAIKKK